MSIFKKAVSFLMASSIVATTMLSASFLSVSAVETTTTDLPSSYSSVEKGYVTSVKHQGNTSTCWAHATMASCESSMIIHNGYDTSLDLSELHLAYSAYHTNHDKMGMFDSPQSDYMGNYIMAGNNTENALIALANQQGVVTEDANHGQFSSQKLLMNSPHSFNVSNPEALYSYNEATVTNAYKAYTTNPDLVKEYIMKYGSGTMEYRADDNYFNTEHNAQYCYEEFISTSHAVAVVGWDDNYPKENFNVDGHIPNENGAWLIKNSYGAESYNDGYIWISYEDLTINKHPSIFYELSDKYLNSNVYQYDDICVESFLYDGEDFVGEAYMANMFTAQKDSETLDAVSFYTSNEVLDYTIDIYTGVEDETDPTNGTLKTTVSGEDLKMGYHTIDLETPVALNKGEKFSVVVNIKDNNNPTSNVLVNIDAPDNVRTQIKNSDFGESFYSHNGQNWTDLKTVETANMRIKAFTSSDDFPTVTPDYYDTVNGKTREQLHNELGKTIENYSPIFNQNYDIKFDRNYLNLMYGLKYAKDAYNNPDIFLALEFEFINNNLIYLHNLLYKYNFEENIKYHETNDLWTYFTNRYDTSLAEANDTIGTPDTLYQYDSKMKEVYKNYINSVISEGAYNSYLQKFGDADNNYEVNISDATEIQKILADYKDFDFYSYYNSDVNGDSLIDIRDVTEIQKFLADRTQYFPVYDKQFDGEEINKNIDADTALTNLNKAIYDIEMSGVLDSYNQDAPVLLLNNLYSNACTVLADSQSYHPNVINFKARCINYTLQNYLESQA